MSKNYFVHDFGGYKELMKSAEVDAMLLNYGNMAVQQLGEEFEAEILTGGSSRHTVHVKGTTARANAKNLRDNRIWKVVSNL